VFAVLVPLLIVVTVVVSTIILPLFAIIILLSYVIGISSLKDAIRSEKIEQLSIINEKLATLATKIITHQTVSDEGDTNYLKNINEQFLIMEQIGIKIEKLAESPRSLTAVVKIFFSSVLPLISFVSVEQLNLFV
jgi:hypothetical protein